MIYLERLVKHGFDVSGKKIEFSIHIFELINIIPVVTLQQVIHFQVMTITYISEHHNFPFSLKWDSVVRSNNSLSDRYFSQKKCGTLVMKTSLILFFLVGVFTICNGFCCVRISFGSPQIIRFLLYRSLPR